MVAVLGPVCAGVALLAGRAFGASFGELGGSIAMAVCAILLWIGVAIWRDGSTGGAAAAAWMFAGVINVFAGNSLALLGSGEHVLGAHIADIDRWRRHERVTFADGVLRADLMELDGHIAKRTDGRRSSSFYYCEATPIVADGWKQGDAVKLWALDDRASSLAFSEQTFHVTDKPDHDCVNAIAAVVAKHDVKIDADPIYLERVITSTDPTMVTLGGIVAAGLTALVWLGVLAWRWVGYRRWKARRKPD